MNVNSARQTAAELTGAGSGVVRIEQLRRQALAYDTTNFYISANVTAIRNSVDAAAAAPAATNLVETFTKVAAYWKAKSVPDAVTFAETARDAAKAIADGKGDKADNLMKLQQQCGACHMAHRAGGRGNFTFK